MARDYNSANYGYNDKVADVIRRLGQGTVKKTLNGFRSVSDVPISSNSETYGIDSGRVRTGSLRGNQRIQGQIQVVDTNGRKVMVMGYGKGKF